MEQPPTSSFATYEQEFQHIIQTIRQILDAKNQRGEQRKAELRKVEIELDDADDIVSQLEIEIQGIPQSIRPEYTRRLRAVKTELNNSKKLSKDVHSEAARLDLLDAYKGGSTCDDLYGDRSDRERLVIATEQLEYGSQKLHNSTNIALQTEDYGAEILRTLRTQREQIEHSGDVLRSADTHIDRASGTVKDMITQMYRQRIVLGAIAVVLVIVIIIILYFKLFRR